MAEPSLHATQVHHPFPAARYLPYLTSEDVAALDKEQAAVVLVVGAIEQHGPHLATGTDLILGASTLALAIERLDPSVQLWVLPPLPYSRSVEHTAFAGTFTLEQETLAAVVHDIGASCSTTATAATRRCSRRSPATYAGAPG
jgi:creatinine amidohydrolase/Fe(II)-dependent formamide hydrolase-like protein